MTGRIVKEGDPPPHDCEVRYMPTLGHNLGAVWECECGKYYKLVERVSGWDEYARMERRWTWVKDAEGAEWVKEVIPREEYIVRSGYLRDRCVEHGRVSRKHVHTRRV